MNNLIFCKIIAFSNNLSFIEKKIQMKKSGKSHSRSRSRSNSRKDSRSDSNPKQNRKSHSNSTSPKNFSNDHYDSHKSKKRISYFIGIRLFFSENEEVKRDDLTCLVLNLSGTTTESDIFKFLTKVKGKK